MPSQIHSALCASVEDKSIFFPQPTKIRGASYDKSDLEQGVQALKICAACPIANWCLEYALKDPNSRDYGIYGGTLPYERRVALKLSEGTDDQRPEFQKMIRYRASRAGVIPVKVIVKDNEICPATKVKKA